MQLTNLLKFPCADSSAIDSDNDGDLDLVTVEAAPCTTGVHGCFDGFESNRTLGYYANNGGGRVRPSAYFQSFPLPPFPSMDSSFPWSSSAVLVGNFTGGNGTGFDVAVLRVERVITFRGTSDGLSYGSPYSAISSAPVTSCMESDVYLPSAVVLNDRTPDGASVVLTLSDNFEDGPLHIRKNLGQPTQTCVSRSLAELQFEMVSGLHMPSLLNVDHDVTGDGLADLVVCTREEVLVYARLPLVSDPELFNTTHPYLSFHLPLSGVYMGFVGQVLPIDFAVGRFVSAAGGDIVLFQYTGFSFFGSVATSDVYIWRASSYPDATRVERLQVIPAGIACTSLVSFDLDMQHGDDLLLAINASLYVLLNFEFKFVCKWLMHALMQRGCLLTLCLLLLRTLEHQSHTWHACASVIAPGGPCCRSFAADLALCRQRCLRGRHAWRIELSCSTWRDFPWLQLLALI